MKLKLKPKTPHLAVSVGLLALAGSLPFALRASALARPADGPAHANSEPKKAPRLTYTKDIAPIIYNNCTSCHHTGEVAPFTLQSYNDVRKHAQTIAAVTESRYMPPWKADSHGEFVGERRLSTAQIHTLQQWLQDGMPEGNATDLPKMPIFPSGWRLGTPDLVVQPPAAYTLAADGEDVYRCFVIPTTNLPNNGDKDRYLSGVEVHPGNGKVVHHIIVYLDTTGAARKLEEQARQKDPNAPGYTAFGGPGFTPTGALGGWVPGYDPVTLPAGVGILLPKGADIVVQVHYHKDGKPETDLSKVGLYFSKGEIDKRVRTLPLINPFLYIAPGDAHYAREMRVDVPENITALDIVPHMHLLGHDMTVTAKLPDGGTKTLVNVPDWDFNWQTRYTFKQPIALPKGAQISLLAHYDNSASNGRNPNSPPKEVTWGEQTTDEMCIAFIGYTIDAEHLIRGVEVDDKAEVGGAIMKGMTREMIAQFDKDNDGKLSADELADMITFMQQGRTPGTGRVMAMGDPKKLAQKAITLFDRNGDHELDADEMGSVAALLRGRGAHGGQ